MTYKEFINAINNGDIKQINFSVKEYSHYHNCKIRAYKDIVNFKGRQIYIPLIECKLTTDDSETQRFYHKFNEDCKLFKIKGITYTLEQIWDKIQITEISYSN